MHTPGEAAGYRRRAMTERHSGNNFFNFMRVPPKTFSRFFPTGKSLRTTGKTLFKHGNIYEVVCDDGRL
jgi:hypothetical protein